MGASETSTKWICIYSNWKMKFEYKSTGASEASTSSNKLNLNINQWSSNILNLNINQWVRAKRAQTN